MLSLPKEWVERNGLIKGAPLQVDDAGTELRISYESTESVLPVSKSLIDAKGKALHVIRAEVISAYLTNKAVLEIRGHRPKDAEPIKGVLRNLTGMEIVEETRHCIIAKDLLDIREVSIATLIRRIDVTVRSMIDDVANGKPTDLDSRDVDVNRLVFLAYRSMRKALIDPRASRSIGGSSLLVLTGWNLILQMEKIGDCCKRVARMMPGLNQAKRERLRAVMQSLGEHFSDTMKSYYTQQMPLAMNAELRDPELQQMLTDAGLTVELLLQLRSAVSAVKHMSRSVIVSIQ